MKFRLFELDDQQRISDLHSAMLSRELIHQHLLKENKLMHNILYLRNQLTTSQHQETM